MNITTEIQDTGTQTFCDDCTGAMTPDDAGEWITCPNARDTCIDCCPCCGSGLFFEFGGRVFPTVATGAPWNGFVTPIVTRAIAAAVADFMDEEAALATMTFEGQTLVVGDLEGNQADDHLTPTPGGHYDLGGLGFAFSRDNGPADYDQVDR